MNMTNRTINAKREMSLLVFGSIVLLICAIALPMLQAHAAGCSRSAATNASSSNSNGNSGTTSSVITDFRSATLVCVSRSSALTTLGLDSGSGSSSKKATICHIPLGNPDAKNTLSVGKSSVSAHLAHGDSMGSCSDLLAQSYVEALPSCTAIGGGSAAPGVWLPGSAVGNGTSLNFYLTQVQGGIVSGLPDSSSRSYREIAAQ